MSKSNDSFVIIERNSENFSYQDKVNIIIKIGKQLNNNKIDIVSTVYYYNNIIKTTNLDHIVRRKCISDINDFNTINKYLHMIKIFLESIFNEIKFGQITEEIFDKKILYINTILFNCKSHFEFCIKKIELTINMNSVNMLNNNIYAFYRNNKFIDTNRLYHIIYPYLNLKYKCVLGNLMVQIDDMGDIILGPYEMFSFIHIIHSDIYQIIDNLTIDDELSYILNNHILDTQILKFNSIIDYNDLVNTKIEFIPTKKINNLLESLLNFTISDSNKFNDYISIFKSLLFECRLSTIDLLNKKEHQILLSNNEIKYDNCLPCIINNYVHHIVFSNYLIKIKDKIMHFTNISDINYDKLQSIGYDGLKQYILNKCKININPNELFFIPIAFAKYLDSLFFHNIFSLWDFIWKLAVHQIVSISNNPEDLDADLYMYLKLFIFGVAKIRNIEYLTLMMENSLLTQEDIIKYKLNKIPNKLINYFSNTISDNSDNLILYSNDVCTLSNVETILLSFKNIVDYHDKIN